MENQGWVEEGHVFQGTSAQSGPIPPKIHQDLLYATALEPTAPAPFSPVWQMSPVPEDSTVVNFDLLSSDRFFALEQYVDSHRISAISDVVPISEILGNSVGFEDENPRSIVLQPIFEDFLDTSAVVGHYLAVVEWERYFSGVLHEGANGVVVVLRNSCKQAYTFSVYGHEAIFLGEGDLHDSSYNKYKKSAELFDPAESIRTQEDDHCFYKIDLYPSDSLKEEYVSADPIIYTVIVLAIMFGTALSFFLYEVLVQQRQQQVLDKVAKTQAIVSSLFPENVRDRLLHGDDNDEGGPKRGKDKNALYGKQGLKSFLDEAKAGDMDIIGESKPIADLFPHTTVGYQERESCEMSGLTDALTLASTFFAFFRSCLLIFLDSLRGLPSENQRKSLFCSRQFISHLTRLPSSAVCLRYVPTDDSYRKIRTGTHNTISQQVETVGDCYVAVCGLPEPRKDHAVVMSLFARDCMMKMKELVRELEVTLGPDTADLANRFGLHSGPCTAGEMSRRKCNGFQLNDCQQMLAFRCT